jgi:hypothetical protein
MPLERAGGQAQFIVHEVPTVKDKTAIGPLLLWIEKNLHKELSLPLIARQDLLETTSLSVEEVAAHSGFLSLESYSPWNNAVFVGEAPYRTIFREQRQPDDLNRPFGYGLRPTVAVEVGGSVARIGGIDLDSGVAQFVCELHGEHVERGLRCGIAEIFIGDEFKRRIAGLRERTQSTRNIDNARGWRLAQQREHDLRYSDRADEIHPIVALDRFEAASRGRAVTLDGYAGVIDKNVQMAEVGVDPACRGVDGGRLVEVMGM